MPAQMSWLAIMVVLSWLAHAQHLHLPLDALNVSRFERIQQAGVEQARIGAFG